MAKTWIMTRLSKDTMDRLDGVAAIMQQAREMGQADYEIRWDGSFSVDTILRRLLDEVEGHNRRSRAKKVRS